MVGIAIVAHRIGEALRVAVAHDVVHPEFMQHRALGREHPHAFLEDRAILALQLLPGAGDRGGVLVDPGHRHIDPAVVTGRGPVVAAVDADPVEPSIPVEAGDGDLVGEHVARLEGHDEVPFGVEVDALHIDVAGLALAGEAGKLFLVEERGGIVLPGMQRRAVAFHHPGDAPEFGADVLPVVEAAGHQDHVVHRLRPEKRHRVDPGLAGGKVDHRMRQFGDFHLRQGDEAGFEIDELIVRKDLPLHRRHAPGEGKPEKTEEEPEPGELFGEAVVFRDRSAP